jgi:hypothetical protein
MKPFRHFLITHFNISRGDAKLNADNVPIDRDGQPVRTAEWLEHRFMLFERYCLPSILGQTNQDFIWFIRYDPDAAGDCGGRLARYAAYRNLRPIAKIWYATAIQREISPDTECVVTTRIDTDDAFHREVMADIQRNVRPGMTEFINFQNGYVYEHASGLVRPRDYPDSPFVSFVEHPRLEPLRTVSRFSHLEVSKIAPVRQLAGEPRWLQVVHERNLSNRLGYSPFGPVDLEPGFTIGATGEALMRRLGLPQDNPPSTPR